MTWWGSPAMSAFIAAAYLGLLSALWTWLIIGTGTWGRKWYLHRPQTDDAGKSQVQGEHLRVSICIPARNEQDTIGTCVASALASRWPNLEVIVVDDRSSDATAEAARTVAVGDDRLRVVTGEKPGPGWAGKPWACARAAGEATGDLLCFVDADVTLAPDAVAMLVDTMATRRVSLISAYGSWELRSFWERVLIPAIGWLIRGAVDLEQVNDPGRPEAFANGQVILVNRGAYESMGGHAVVRDQILDDVRLAQQFKRRGYAAGMFVAPWAFSVRLYSGLGEIVRGYSKNIYEGMGRVPMIGLGAVLFIIVGALLPFVALFAGVVARAHWGWAVPGNTWLAWCAVVCALQFVFRWCLERRDGRTGAVAWAHPLANVVLVWILLRSIFSVEVSWKGRDFVDGRAN